MEFLKGGQFDLLHPLPRDAHRQREVIVSDAIRRNLRATPAMELILRLHLITRPAMASNFGQRPAQFMLVSTHQTRSFVQRECQQPRQG